LISAKKSLGQHFLRDPNTAARIAESITQGECEGLIEIGPGDGFLTHHLFHHTDKIVAVELDQRAIPVLQEKFPDLKIIHQDILKADWKELRSEHGFDRKLRVVGNLPYYITSQILFSLLQAHEHIERAVIMTQLEVAKRIVSAPRNKDYGILSIMTQLFAEATLEFKLSPNVFRPKPRVESAVLSLDLKNDTEENIEWAPTFRLVKAAFGQRRKTLRNALASYSNELQKDIPEEIRGKRAEELSPQDFVDLVKYFSS